jgi:methylenetetrahydrofolate reductase (NADPH)
LTKNNLTSIPRTFHVTIPEALADEVMDADDKHAQEIGVNWAVGQVQELFNNNVPSIHFYIMQNSEPIKLLMSKLKNL